MCYKKGRIKEDKEYDLGSSGAIKKFPLKIITKLSQSKQNHIPFSAKVINEVQRIAYLNSISPVAPILFMV